MFCTFIVFNSHRASSKLTFEVPHGSVVHLGSCVGSISSRDQRISGTVG